MNTPTLTLPIPSTLPQRWRHALPALLLLLSWILYLYRDTAQAMVSIWSRSETFTHGFLVPPIVVWLVWRQRKALAAQTPRPALGAFAFIAVASLAWFLGELAAVHSLTQFALVMLLVAAVVSVLGRNVASLIMFPLGFSFFAVPVGEFLLPYFMEWTANFTVFALRLSGIPVYREGLNFVIPSGSWSVIEACSGVRYLIASLTVGTLFAYLNYQSSKRRAIFVAVSVVVPVIANWLRAYMIVMLGHLSDNKLAAGVDHLIYGWIFFGIVIMLMFVVGSRWAEPEPAAAAGIPTPSVLPIAPINEKIWSATAYLACMVALPHVALWAVDRGVSTDAVQLTAPKQLSSNWQATMAAAVDFKPAFQNPSAETNSSYTSRGQVVGLYVAYYRHQNYSHKLVGSDNVLVPSQSPQWVRLASANRTATLDNEHIAVRTTEFRATAPARQGKERHLVVWQLYWINGMLTSSDYVAKAYGAYYRLTGRGDDAAVIVAYALEETKAQADSVLENFLSTNYAFINENLLKTRQNK